MVKQVVIVMAVLLLAGCATVRGFDRGALRQQLAKDTPHHVTNSDIQQALELKPQLKFPFRLAVYLQPGSTNVADNEWSPNSGYSQPSSPSASIKDWRWEGEDKDQILSEVEKLKSDNVISDVFVIPQARVPRTDMESIRFAAAEHGADAVLIVNGIADVDRYNNYSAFLYLTIVGMWLVPGTHADSLFALDGAMWDVKNQYLYLSVESEGLASKMGPTMVLQNKKATNEAKRLAVQSFGPELSKRLKAIAALK